MDTATGGSENEDDHEVLRGAQLSAKVDFSTKKSDQIQLTPIIVDFRRLLQCKSSVDIIPGVSTTTRSIKRMVNVCKSV